MAYTKAQIKDSLQRVRKFIKTNNRRPNTVKLANQTVTEQRKIHCKG